MKSTKMAIAALLACGVVAAAEDTARGPCGSEFHAQYAPVGSNPTLRVWISGDSDLAIDAACADGLRGSFRIIVTLAGSFRGAADASQLLERIGAISRMTTIRYWSVTDRNWTGLLNESIAVESATASRQRPDFAAGDMRNGSELFYAQRDNRGTKAVYRMRVTTAEPDRIIVQVENVNAIRRFFFTVFGRGDLHTVHFLTRRSDDTWDYYLVTAARTLPPGNTQPSLVNRAAALFRFVAGQQTDKEPPLAPR